MRQQIGLFETQWQQPARARRTDPVSSHAAADEAERRGFIAGHKRLIVAAVVRSPGATAHQLALVTGLSVVQIDRRTGELEATGWLTRPGKDAAHALRHYPTAKAERHFPGGGPQRPESVDMAIRAGEVMREIDERRQREVMAGEEVIADRRLT